MVFGHRGLGLALSRALVASSIMRIDRVSDQGTGDEKALGLPRRRGTMPLAMVNMPIGIVVDLLIHVGELRCLPCRFEREDS